MGWAIQLSLLCVFILFLPDLGVYCEGEKGEEEEENEAPNGIRDPTLCEVCKYLAVELQGRLDETGKSKEVIETGHGLDPKFKKKKDYKKSELRLIEAVHEPHVCDRILEYNIHAERKKSLRYAKGQSETMRTLHGLVDKGVKVELGIPYEMWDQPSAEITNMQRQCFKMVEDLEDYIEDWYWGPQEQRLIDHLCRDVVLKGQDTKCLEEEFGPENGEEKKEEKEKPKKSENAKGETGTPGSSLPPTSAPSADGPSKDAKTDEEGISIDVEGETEDTNGENKREQSKDKKDEL